MSDNKLDMIEGYSDTLATITALEHEGRDYRSGRGETQQTIDRFHPRRLSLSVSEVIEETTSTKTLRLTSINGYLPPFQAGQYVNLFVNISGVKTSRPYAISSSPSERGYYDLTVKRVPGGFVSAYLLDRIHPGQELESTGPMGNFFYNPLFHGNDLVFLAGGSGVTPAASMISDMAYRKGERKIHLIYGSMNLEDIIFKDRLDCISERHKNIRVTHVITDPPPTYNGPAGFMTAELIQSLVGDVQNKTFYLCGPQIMYDFCGEQLQHLGVPRHRIRMEVNGPPANPEKSEAWPAETAVDKEVSVSIRGVKSYKTRAGEPLLNSLERNGVQVEAACRSGECSMCRVKVLSGDVFEPEQSHVRRSDRKYGYVHACTCYPVGDIEIIL